MGTKNKKKNKKVDLLKMSNPERIKIIKEVKEKIQQNIAEAKLWQSLLDVESLTINGSMVYKEDGQLSGYYLNTKL